MITRHNVEPRYSDMAVYSGVAYLAGQIANNTAQHLRGQTAEVLGMIDGLLVASGSEFLVGIGVTAAVFAPTKD